MEHIIATRPICTDSDGKRNWGAVSATLDAILENRLGCMEAASRTLLEAIKKEDLDGIRCTAVVVANYLADNSKVL